MDFERKTFDPQPYLYVDCECPMEGPAIADTMGKAFGQIMEFVRAQKIEPMSPPMTVYHHMPDPGGAMQFRCGMMIGHDDDVPSAGQVKRDTLPAGDAMTTTHVGPYSTLNQSHGALWKHMEAEGIRPAMPVWEVYVDDPGETDEDKLRTEIYRKIGN